MYIPNNGCHLWQGAELLRAALQNPELFLTGQAQQPQASPTAPGPQTQLRRAGQAQQPRTTSPPAGPDGVRTSAGEKDLRQQQEGEQRCNAQLDTPEVVAQMLPSTVEAGM